MTGAPAGKRRPQPYEAIQLGGDGPNARHPGVRFAVVLCLYMRALCALWMFRGLMLWFMLIAPGTEPLSSMTPLVATATVLFAVSDLVAAVGLWFAAAWSGLLWLFVAAAGVVASAVLPDFGFGGRATVILDLVLIGAYVALSWSAAREPAR